MNSAQGVLPVVVAQVSFEDINEQSPRRVQCDAIQVSRMGDPQLRHVARWWQPDFADEGPA